MGLQAGWEEHPVLSYIRVGKTREAHPLQDICFHGEEKAQKSGRLMMAKDSPQETQQSLVEDAHLGKPLFRNRRSGEGKSLQDCVWEFPLSPLSHDSSGQ